MNATNTELVGIAMSGRHFRYVGVSICVFVVHVVMDHRAHATGLQHCTMEFLYRTSRLLPSFQSHFQMSYTPEFQAVSAMPCRNTEGDEPAATLQDEVLDQEWS